MTQDLSNATKNVEKEAASGKQQQGDKGPEVVETSLVATDDNVQNTRLEEVSTVQVSTVKTAEFLDDKVVRVTALF